MDPRKTLGRNLKRLILEHHDTVELFAHENEIDKGWLSRVINGKIDPGFTRIVRVTRILNVTLEDLYPMKRRK